METTKFKKSLSMLLSIIMVVITCSIAFGIGASAATEVTLSDTITYTLEDGVLTFYGTGDMPNYSSSPFTSSSVTTVIYSEGITSTGNYMFYNCTTITKVVFSSTITTLSSCTFRNCTGLTYVIIPENVTTIGTGLFRGCTGLTTLFVPSDLPAFTNNCFADSTTAITVYYQGTEAEFASITHASTGNDRYTTATVIEQSYLVEQALSDDVSWILTNDEGHLVLTISGEGAMPDNTDTNGDGTISGIDSPWYGAIGYLETLIIEEGITSIGAYNFHGTASYSTLSLPTTLVTIGDYAFQGQKLNLTSLIIPEGVTSIGEYAFRYSNALNTIYLPSTLVSIGDYALDASNNTYTNTTLYYAGTEAELAACTSGTSDAIEPQLTNIVYNHVCTGSGGIISVFVPATCTEYAKQYWTGATCSECGRSDITTYEYAGTTYADHTPVDDTDTNKAATCTSTGWTDATVCDVCGQTVDAGYELDMLDHTYSSDYTGTNDFYTQPECGVDGYWTVYCTECGGGEKTVTDTGSELTCEYPTAAELYAYTADELAEAGITYYEATCANDAYWTNVPCDLCGSTTETITDEGSQEAHAFTEFVETVAPSCSAQGYTTYQCSMCDATENKDFVPVLEHTYEYTDLLDDDDNVVYEVDADGNTVYEYNSEGVLVPVAVQVLTNGKFTEATCANDAYTTYTCTVVGCGCTTIEYDEGTATNNHSYKLISETESTCTVAGYAHYECETCDGEYDVAKELAEHVYLIFEKVYQAGTCQSNSINEMRCNVCYATGYVEVQDTYGECEDADGDSFCDTCGAIVEDSFWDKLIRFFLEFFEVIASWFS